MAKLTLDDFGSTYASTQHLNSNNTLIENALEKTLSRDGTSPNAMAADFDMNGHRILNLPYPIFNNDPIRLIDVTTGIDVHVSAPGQPRTIFSILTDAEIAIVQAGENGNDLTAKVNTAMSLNPSTTWYFPEGWYFFNNLVSVPRGIRWLGAGKGATNIKMGGNPWAMEQLNPNGTTAVRGFSCENITFYFSQNGIRLNSDTTGIDDTAGSMYYIIEPTFKQCEFLYNGSIPNTYTMISWNKCFNGIIANCKFSGCYSQLSLRGCDLNAIRDNRMDNANSVCIKDFAEGTFGSTNVIEHNDMNNPKNGFIASTSRDAIIRNNHLELDFPPGSSGTGGNIPYLINYDGANAFKLQLIGNRIEGDIYCDNWLRYASSNPYSLTVRDNGSTGPGSPGVSITSKPYFTNSGTRFMCTHSGNLYLGSDNSFPMNSRSHDESGAGDILLGASYPGISNSQGVGGTFNGIQCSQGDILVPPDSNAAHFIEWSDWTGFPANTLKGTFRVVIQSSGTVAGQILSYKILDGAGVVANSTITHTTANMMYYTTMLGLTAFTTGVKIQVWNADTGHGGNVAIRAIVIKGE